MEEESLKDKAASFAKESPVKFVALTSFCTLGALPLISFVVYGVVTLIASIIGALVVELFLLAAGLAGLVFVLIVVTCISACITSLFAAAYFTFNTVASSTLFKTRGTRLFLHTPGWPSSPSSNTQPQDGGDADKRK